MEAKNKVTIIFILALALAACNTSASKPTETPVPTATSLPTLTSTPEPTITATPTEKPTATTIPPTEEPTETAVPPTKTPSDAVLPMPSGKPVTEWEGIPIMPDALAGDGDSAGYAFIVKASPEEVQAFYEKEIAKLGWDLLATGQGGTTGTVLLIFTKDTDTFSVSIIPQADGVIYTLLVK